MFYKMSNSSNWSILLSSYIYDTNSNTVNSLFLLKFLTTWSLTILSHIILSVVSLAFNPDLRQVHGIEILYLVIDGIVVLVRLNRKTSENSLFLNVVKSSNGCNIRYQFFEKEMAYRIEHNIIEVFLYSTTTN